MKLRKHPADHRGEPHGPTTFPDCIPKLKDSKYPEKHPIVRPNEDILKNAMTVSGKPLRLSENAVTLKDAKILKIAEDF